ncbi:MAG: hypothetical protein U5L98_08535 [Halomonas sp.]|nr:hypothetical protein [Halomonas sp.]MDZ7852672.1 hypothetical protein [Halomonas sp.]
MLLPTTLQEEISVSPFTDRDEDVPAPEGSVPKATTVTPMKRSEAPKMFSAIHQRPVDEKLTAEGKPRHTSYHLDKQKRHRR